MTVGNIICQNYENTRCVFCGNVGVSRRRGVDQCRQVECVVGFRREADRVESDLIEIRGAGAMGKGVFAKADISRFQLLGEYLGELLPCSTPEDTSDAYQFNLRTMCIIGKYYLITFCMSTPGLHSGGGIGALTAHNQGGVGGAGAQGRITI